MSVNTCNIASFAAAVKVTYTGARAHTRVRTHKRELPHRQSKLGACSLNPIYGSPIVFLDALSDTGKRGQNSSTHMRREKIYICVFESERETEMDRQDKEDGEVETDWQA